jgi:hypothetical protein
MLVLSRSSKESIYYLIRVESESKGCFETVGFREKGFYSSYTL